MFLFCLCTRIHINLLHLDNYAICVDESLYVGMYVCVRVCMCFYLLLICCKSIHEYILYNYYVCIYTFEIIGYK